MSKRDDGGQVYACMSDSKGCYGITRLDALADRIAAEKSNALRLDEEWSESDCILIAHNSYNLAEAVIAEGRRREAMEKKASDANRS
jgi:hypothetical protein